MEPKDWAEKVETHELAKDHFLWLVDECRHLEGDPKYLIGHAGLGVVTCDVMLGIQSIQAMIDAGKAGA
jgi:hypothetical protein